MAAPSLARNYFRNRGRKINAPAFRVGIGAVYRELERSGKLSVGNDEKDAELEEHRDLKNEAKHKRNNTLQRRISAWLSDVFD